MASHSSTVEHLLDHEVAPSRQKEDSNDLVRPFEWLTSPESLLPIVRSALVANSADSTCFLPSQSTVGGGCRVLHVGSGSSVLGEYLLEHEDELFDTATTQQPQNCQYSFISQLVNVDKDQETLDTMKVRWEKLRRQHQSQCSTCQISEANETDGETDTATASTRSCLIDARFNRLEFCGTDLSQQGIPYPNASFDLVLDKSTLDCTLCSDSATAWLLHEVYRLLRPQDGTYVLISFHHLELLYPLLQNCPGMNWTVSHSVMDRHIEDLDRSKNNNTSNKNPTALTQQQTVSFETAQSPTTSAEYSNRRTVHVLVARRVPEQKVDTNDLNLEAIIQHVHDTNDDWYKAQHPMLTAERCQGIQHEFQTNGTGNPPQLSLPQCYQALFTDEERDHLSYEYFLEDWHAFVEQRKTLVPPEESIEETTKGTISTDSMTLDIALSFLEEMQ
uniref:Methyltransferase type 11 domain-containing protein n=1 Tax=Entomoneis paludosa TaxID=265537 RepID=A0A6U3BNF0_9STRA